MIKYLGKKAIYERLKAIYPELGISLPKMKDCQYDFYRGSEWLKWTSMEQLGDNLLLTVKVDVSIFAPKFEQNGRPIMHVFIEQQIENDIEIIDETTSNYTYNQKECVYSLIKHNNKSREWVKGVTNKEVQE